MFFIGCWGLSPMLPHYLIAVGIESVLIFFPCLGQGKIVEVFRYHSQKWNSLMFSLCLLCYRQENMRPSIPAWTVMLAESAWCNARAVLARLERTLYSMIRCDSGFTHMLGYLIQLSTEGYQWGGKNERASAEVILKSFALSGELLPREGLVGLHFCWINTP